MRFQESDLSRVIGSTMYGADGEKIGTVGQVFFDDYTNQPEWVTVLSGLFGTNESFVPLAEAQFDQQGDLKVPYDKDTVKDAPNVDIRQGHLSEAEEARLFRHYGRSYADQPYTTATGDVVAASTAGEGERPEGYEAGRGADGAMTPSEGQLPVGTESREAGRPRLRRYVVTEDAAFGRGRG